MAQAALAREIEVRSPRICRAQARASRVGAGGQRPPRIRRVMAHASFVREIGARQSEGRDLGARAFGPRGGRLRTRPAPERAYARAGVRSATGGSRGWPARPARWWRTQAISAPRSHAAGPVVPVAEHLARGTRQTAG